MTSGHSSVEENLLGVRISQDQGDNPLDSDEIRRLLAADVEDRPFHETIEMSSVDPSSPSTSTLDDGATVTSPDSTQNEGSGPTKTREPNGRQNAIFTPWLPETLALLCGLGAFVGIIMILARFNKYEQPQWPSYINLSTVVALLATLLRSMLLQVIEAALGQLKWAWYESPRPLHHLNTLDQASRGPWGSMQLLFTIPRFHWFNLAAIITVASIGIGTFAQQSVKTFVCHIPAPEQVAQIPVARNTSRGFNVLLNPGSADRLQLFDTGMRSALITGLAGSQSLSSLSVDCPTGNCTFGTSGNDTYFSVAFDSFCTDASGLLTQSNPITWSPSYYSGYGSNSSTWANYSIGGRQIVYATETFSTFRHWGRWHPALLMERNLYEFDLPMSTEQEDINNSDPFKIYLIIPASNRCDGDADGIYQTAHNDVDPVEPVNTSLCQMLQSGNVTTYPGSFTLTAAVCSLYPSLRSYLGAIVNGQLQERPAAVPKHLIRARNSSAETISYFAFADPCIINNTVYSTSNYSDAPSLITISGDVRGVTNAGIVDHVVNYTGPLDCLYSLPIDWDQAIGDTLHGVLNSPVPGDCFVTGNYSDIVCNDKWWLATVYNGRNASISSVSRFMQNIADSLTLQLRTIGEDNDGNPAFARGLAMRTEVCTSFDWAWLLYPAVLTALTAVLLAVVASSRASGGTHLKIPWKTSLLPFLVYRVGPEVNDGHESEEDVLSESALEKKAKKIRVEFNNVNGRWQFQKA